MTHQFDRQNMVDAVSIANAYADGTARLLGFRLLRRATVDLCQAQQICNRPAIDNLVRRYVHTIR